VKIGSEVILSAKAMSDALKGKVWGVPNEDGTLYDGEFTGEYTEDNLMIVKIKRKSERQV
jgi:hypothetical protein